MFEEKVREWQVPRYEESGTRRKGWIDELVQNGERWLRSQKSIANIADDVELITGRNQQLSVESNGIQSDIRTFVETMSDLREIATYGSQAPHFKQHVESYNKVIKHIYRDGCYAHKMREVLQYACLGRGYIWPHQSRDKYGTGRSRMTFDALGPLEFIPEQLPADNDVQGCYAGTIVRPMPIAEAHARFEKFQDYIQPISRYDWKAYGTLTMAKRLDFYDRFRFGEESSDWERRYTEIRYTFIRDLRKNVSGETLRFGTVGAPWAYEVPSLGSQLVSRDPFSGYPQSRVATPEDCMMYPQLRLVITCPTCPVPLYDGCAFDWHGEIPAIAVDVNDWPWSPLGYSLIHTVASLERARRRLVSKMDDVGQANLDPPLGFDLNAGVARTQLEKMDMLKSSGYRVGVQGDPEKALRSLLPPGMKVTGENVKQLEILDAMIQKTLGLNDISSLKNLKMSMSQDSMDKFLESLGPIGKGIAANLAMVNTKVANQLKYSIPEYNTTQQLMSYIGEDGLSLETFDYDPQSIIPSHLPGERDGEPSAYQRRDRARWFTEQFAVEAVPEQLLNSTQQQERMIYMMFLQKGAKISTSTIMTKLGVQNYGVVPGDTEYDKWKNEQMEEIVLKAKAQALAQKEIEELGLQPPQGPPPGPGRGKGGGRPNTGKIPGKAEMRGSTSGNPRAIVSTSK